MQLQSFTDFTLRIMLFLAANRGRMVTVKEIATIHKLSFNHVAKICQFLAKLELVTTERGRAGGIKISGDPKLISIGYIVRQAERNRRVVPCLMESENGHNCILTGFCGLTGMLETAAENFYSTLDQYSLADATPAHIVNLFWDDDNPRHKSASVHSGAMKS